MGAGTASRAETAAGAITLTSVECRREGHGQNRRMTERWYYCLRHHQVEGKVGCRASDRLGPYPSEAEAANALAKVEERNREWDNDPRWNDDLD